MIYERGCAIVELGVTSTRLAWLMEALEIFSSLLSVIKT